jgi:hypothetical protein
METHFTEKLEELLRTKSYSSLNEAEKLYVLSLISAAEYAHFSHILQAFIAGSKNEENRLSLSAGALSNLQDVFQKKHQPFYLKSIKLPLKSFQVPIYQAVAASLVFAIGISYLLVPNKSRNSPVHQAYCLSDAEFNKYTQRNGFYSETAEVSIEDEVTQELRNMKLTP